MGVPDFPRADRARRRADDVASPGSNCCFIMACRPSERARQTIDTFAVDLAHWWEEQRAHRTSRSSLGRTAEHPRRSTIVGMAWVALVPRLPRPGSTDRLSADIQSVFVAPEHRGRGSDRRSWRAASAARDRLGCDAGDRALQSFAPYRSTSGWASGRLESSFSGRQIRDRPTRAPPVPATYPSDACFRASSWYWIAFTRTRSAPASSSSPRTFAGTPAASIPAGISCPSSTRAPAATNAPARDHRAVQQGRTHADQAAVFDRGAVDDRAVPDAHARADGGGHAGVGVDGRVVLQVAALAEHDRRPCRRAARSRTRRSRSPRIRTRPIRVAFGAIQAVGWISGRVTVEGKQQRHGPTLSSRG